MWKLNLKLGYCPKATYDNIRICSLPNRSIPVADCTLAWNHVVDDVAAVADANEDE